MCVLRACGRTLDIDAFLSKSRMKPCVIWHRGEPHWAHKPEGPKKNNSGANFAVSNASWKQLNRQTAQAVRFLKKHRNDIKRLSKMPGISTFCLDFPVDTRFGPKVCVQGETFPAELVKLSGSLGLAIWVSIYPENDEE